MSAVQRPECWYVIIPYLISDFSSFCSDDGPLTRSLVSLMLTLNARHKGSIKMVCKPRAVSLVILLFSLHRDILGWKTC